MIHFLKLLMVAPPVFWTNFRLDQLQASTFFPQVTTFDDAEY
jgi:hypothetical protein